MQITPIRTKIFKKNDSLFKYILEHVPTLSEESILVVTSKIVALSEGNTISKNEKEKYIQNISKKTIQTPWAVLTLGTEGWCINAGIDESNAHNEIITLPSDSFKIAHELVQQIKKHYRLKKIGVIISDTRSTPLRLGTLGRAIGCAGFYPTKSYINKRDLFGRKSRITVSNLADALAGSAVCTMGEGNEQMPLARITESPAIFTHTKLSKKDTRLFLLPEEDIFSYLFTVSPTSHKRSKKK